MGLGCSPLGSVPLAGAQSLWTAIADLIGVTQLVLSRWGIKTIYSNRGVHNVSSVLGTTSVTSTDGTREVISVRGTRGV